MTLNFVEENFIIGQKNPDIKPTLQFYKKGFRLNGSATPSWQDIILSGNTALTLVNAKANGLNYLKLFGGTEQTGTPTPDTPMDIVCNNGVVKANTNLYWTEYNNSTLSQEDGVTVKAASSVNVSGMVDCRTIKSFKITAISPLGSFRIFKYGIDNAFIDANSTANIGDIVTFENNVGFFRIQYNYIAVGTENILIYNSAYDLNEAYTDGTTETVEVTGKNLFDKNTMSTQEGWYIGNNSTGEINNSPDNNRVIVIDCKPNTTYSFWHTEGSGGGRAFDIPTDNIAIGDFATKWISSPVIAEKNQVTTYTTSSTAKKLYILAGRKDGTISRPYEEQIADLMVVEGNVATATTYEPYYNGGTATAENLFKVGDYQDIQSVIDGGVTRNVGIKVLDGTENWLDGSVNDIYRYRLTVGDIKIDSVRGMVLSTHFKDISSTSTQIVGGIFSNSNTIYVIPDQNLTTRTLFKQWLTDQYSAGTPVIIVYPLATATTETVTPQPMNIQKGTNNVIITQASIDNLGLEVSYKATV